MREILIKNSNSYDFCAQRIVKAKITLFMSLNFVIHVEKSVFFFERSIECLGFDMNSITEEMITLRNKKITTFIACDTELRKASLPALRDEVKL